VIDRRGFGRIALAGIVGIVLTLVGSCADSDKTVRRIGVLAPGPPDADAFEDFAAPLRELGWIEGRNLVVERRYAEWQPGRQGVLAEELVRLKPDLIISRGTQPTLAAKSATATIPIVMSGGSDPVAMGIVPSLSRPGGNVTGYAFMTPEVMAKQVQVMHEILPAARRIAIVEPELEGGTVGVNAFLLEQAEVIYRSLGAEPFRVKFARPFGGDQGANTIADASRQGAHAVYFFVGESQAAIEVATALRLPVVVHSREALEAGGLMRLEPDLADRSRRVASMVDKILRGARPADIPIEQPTKFVLGVNVKAASALGIAIPQSVVMRADEVIR
jgi:putative ABC transport system substrate-binding protein